MVETSVPVNGPAVNERVPVRSNDSRPVRLTGIDTLARSWAVGPAQRPLEGGG